MLPLVRRRKKTLALLTTSAAVSLAYLIFYSVLLVDPDESDRSNDVIGDGDSLFLSTAYPFVDWTQVNMDTLTGEQLTDYLSWSNSGACNLVQDFGGVMISVDRVPAIDGQKAVCLDRPHLAPSLGGCVVYSFGINNEWSFDETMEKYGCQVYAFDPSMNVSDHHRSEWIHFYRIALDSVDSEVWNGRPGIKSRTLESIYKMLNSGHGDGNDGIIDYLKIDVETAEWRVLPQIVESGMMDKVKQLSVEIHLPNGSDDENEDRNFSLDEYRKLAGILQSLEKYGLVRFDSKRNPWSVGVGKASGLLGDDAPFAYEIAWFNGKLLTSNQPA
jgi:hypothetical protein